MRNQVKAILETGASWRIFLYGNLLVLTVTAIVAMIAAPQRFTATATLMPSMDQGTLVLLGGSVAEAGSLSAMLTGGLFTTPADIYLDLMNSRSVRESLIVRMDLIKYYHDKNMDEALLTLDSHLSSSVTPSGMIVIEFTDKDPKLATDAVNSTIAILDEFNQRIIVTKGRKMRQFLDKRLVEIQDSIQSIGDSLVALQSKYKTLGIPEEVDAVISTYSQIKAQLIAKQYMLDALLQYATPDHPDVVALRRDISSLQGRLSQMEKSGPGGFGAGFGVGFDSLPGVMVEVQKLQQEFEVQGAVYEEMVQQYEMAKLLEKRDAPTLQVVDPARVPQKKSWPKRTLFILASVVASIIFAWAGAVYAEGVNRLVAREDDPLARLINALSADIAFWRRKKWTTS